MSNNDKELQQNLIVNMIVVAFTSVLGFGSIATCYMPSGKSLHENGNAQGF